MLTQAMPYLMEDFPATTTPTMQGYLITEYMGVESAEVVPGTGVLSEFSGGVADLFGGRSAAFEKKLQHAKVLALSHLKARAMQRGADAVVGVDLDYTEFTGNCIGVIASGTAVKLTPISRNGCE